MPRQVGRARIITLAILSIAVLSIALAVLAQTQAQPKPFMTITGEGSRIDYYNVSSTTAPALVIRAYLNNTPVPVTVSLFAFAPTKIYTVGYYYGIGMVSINLTSPLIKEIAGEWQVTGLWPSLLAFITYTSNETRTIRFIILAIPYNPRWITSNEHIAIIATVNLTMARQLPIPRNLTKSTTTQITNTKINVTDLYGYTYVGSCMGNNVVLNNPPGLPGASSWQLESCYEFNGPVPFFFISWGSGVWNNGVTSIGFVIENAIAQANSGLYATYAIYNYSNDNYITTITSASPTIIFSNQINMVLSNSYCGVVGGVEVKYGSSLSIGCSSNDIIYYVPGSSGTVFVGPVDNIAAVTFYDCLYQSGSCIPIYVANGTMVLSLSGLSSSSLVIYPFIDLGNGSITNTLTLLINQGLAGEAFTVLDGQYFSYNPSTGSVSYSSACSNSPTPPASVEPYRVAYYLSNVITTYKAVLPGWAPDVGSAIAEIIADFITDDPIISHFIGFGISYLLQQYASSSSIYQSYIVGIETNDNVAWQLYTTFVGTPAIETTQDVESYWPMGIVINGSGYYLDYLPYLYPWPGATVCQG